MGKHISYSQYSTYEQCNYKYKLKYVDQITFPGTGGYIHLLFGTAMHETIQHYLTVMYNESAVAADKLGLLGYLQERMTEEFLKLKEECETGYDPCTKEELIEFTKDGYAIIKWLKKRKNRIKFYSKRGWKLEGIELKLDHEIYPGLNFVGYIDVIMKSKTGKYKIIDLKTSTKGWGYWQKNDEVKSGQLILYKMFYAKQLNVSIDKIDIEFHILRRKVDLTAEYPAGRFQRHIPASGTISRNKVERSFMNFVDTVFALGVDGEYNRRTKISYPKKPSKLCDWCDFKSAGDCDGKLDV